MVQVIYGDVLLLIDFCMNFFVLYMTGLFMRRHARALCLAGASLIGGIYSVARVFINGNNIFDFFINLAVGLLMCYIAFGGYKFVKTVLIFFGAAALIGGAMFCTYYFLGSYHADLFGNVRSYSYSHMPLWLFAVLAAVSLLLSWIFSYFGRETTEKRELAVRIEQNGKSTQLRLLLDSGNLVKEPISGKYVIMAGIDMVEPLLPPDLVQALARSDGPYLLQHRFRLVCAAGIDGKSSTFYAFQPDKIYFENKRRTVEIDAYIAVTGADVTFDGCEGIVHPSAIA